MKKDRMLETAWEILESSVVQYQDKRIGTIASLDNSRDALNYDQIFVRDFAISAFAYLLNGDYEMVKNFLSTSSKLQAREIQMNCFEPSKGLLPASFKYKKENGSEELIPDYGENAIARVAPVDGIFWWLYILRTYIAASGDKEFSDQEDIQTTIKLIIELSLTQKFSMFPTLFVPDGSFMIDRRMGVYGYPLEIQVLFYIGLKSAVELLNKNEENEDLLVAIKTRIGHLNYHLRKYYWLDLTELNSIYRYKVEEYDENTLNLFNVYPQTIPGWLEEFLGENDGYFIGNLGPARMDFRFFTSGNFLAVLSSLATDYQSKSIVELIKSNKKNLIGEMPIKIVYPALKGKDWKNITGYDQKNIPWSYHNGGSWPSLLWSFVASSIKTGNADLAEESVEIAEKKLAKDDWQEYYDGRQNRFIGKESRKFQIWTIASYIISNLLLENNKLVSTLMFDEEDDDLRGETENTKY